MSQRAEAVQKAKLAEQVHKYDEMVIEMKKVVNMDANLTNEEIKLLYVAYKNLIAAPRAAWKTLNSVKEKDEEQKTDMEKIGIEIKNICKDLLDVLESSFIPNMDSNESDEFKVFYYKMKGDYNGYLAEIATGSEKQIAAQSSLVDYKSASECAYQALKPADPIRLELALNFSTFFYDVLKSPNRACQLAKKAFEDAIEELDTLSEDSYNESQPIMQLLRDNLILWTSGKKGDEDGG